VKHFTVPLVRVAIREQMAGEPEIEIAKRADTLSNVVSRTAVVVIGILAIIMALPEFGLNIGPLIAGLGLVGLAVGFGAQNLVKDVINGLFILVENQYAEGDVVEISGIAGLVEDINLRRTVLRDMDGTVHFVPHSQIANTSNLSKAYSRINLNVRVAYESDLEQVIEVINRVGKELAASPIWGPQIKTPPQALRVDNFGDSGIEIKVVGDTEPIQQWGITGELRLRLKKAFDAEGIIMPHALVAPVPEATRPGETQPIQDRQGTTEAT
jgi:small conductance mechanosensitive channel